MPLQRCQVGERSGWRWGKSGKCYVGSGAKAKAAKQGAAIKASGFQEHDIKMRNSNMLFQKITTNFVGVVRNDTMEGRDYLVAPMIMIVEGVHEGSNGPLYYPADELSKTPAVWNHKPVVVYHPQANGEGVSACDPDILTNRKVGVIMNTTFDAGKLKAEAWLEIDRMNRVDERIAEAIEKNEAMELSTGLFTDNENTEGDWNGEHYDAIARNYRPDHLALLPDLKGACSIEDGAGFLRLNEQGDFLVDNPAPDVTEKYIRLRQKNPDLFKKGSFRTIIISASKGIKAVVGRLNKPPKVQAGSVVIQVFLFDKKKWTTARARAWVKSHKPTTHEMSFGDIRQRLQSILKEKFVDEEYIYIEDVFDDYLIYERGANLYKQNYNDVDGTISFKGLPVVVVKETNYVTKNERKKRMNKEKLVEALIKNEGTQWGDDDKNALMELEDDVLKKMVPVENETDGEAEAKAKADVEAKAKTDSEAKAKASENKGDGEDDTVENMSAEEYIDKKVPSELKGVFQSGLASYKANKSRLIDIITSNEKNIFTKEQLEAKGLDELRALVSLAVHTEKQQEELNTLNYAGQGDPTHNEMEEEPMDVPVLNFDEKK